MTVVNGSEWTKFSLLTEFLNSSYDFQKREIDDSKSILEDIEKKIKTSLDTISSDEELDLEAMDEEDN